MPDLLETLKSRLSSKGAAAKNARIALAFSEIESYEANAGICAEIVREYPQARILALNYFLSKHLAEKQVAHDCVFSSAMSEEHASLNEQAEIHAQNWFKDNGQDFTLHEGLSLGSCFELPALFLFQTVLKFTTDIEIYLAQARPELLVFFNTGRAISQGLEVSINFNVFNGLLPLLCKRQGVDLVEVEAPLVSVEKKANGLLESFMLAPAVNIFGVNVQVPRFVYPILKNIFILIKNIAARKYRFPGKPNIFVVSATACNYMGSKLVEKILQSKKFNLFVWDGESKEPAVTNIIPQRLARGALQAKFREMFESHREKLKRTTVYKGFSIFELYPFFFEKIYAEKFPDLVAHAEMVRTQLVKHKIKAIITHSDHSVYERMTLLVGNSLAIATICIQHGLEEPVADSRLGYPSISGRHFVWGKVNKDYRMARGVAADRIDIVGCPLHEFVEYGIKGGDLKLDAPGTILFISNSGGQGRVDNRMSFTDNEEQIKLMLETMKSFPQKTLIIKPRFHDLQMGVYQKLIQDAGVSNAVILQKPIAELLKECDLFFCIFSTAALEGMILGKPGIQFRFVFDGKKAMMKRTGTIPMPFTGYGALLGLDKALAPDLKVCIESIYKSEELRGKLNAGRIRFLRDYANLGSGEPTDNFIRALEKSL